MDQLCKILSALLLTCSTINGQIILPGPVMRTIAAGGGGSCNTLVQTNGGATATAVTTRFGAYQAAKFTTGGSGYTACKVALYVARTGTPTGTWIIRIYSHNAGTDRPDVEITGTASSALNKNTFPASADWQEFTDLSYALNASTTYWVVIVQSSNGDETNYIDAHHDDTFLGNGWSTSSDGVTWTTTTNRGMLVRIYSS